ncbi:MAG TPA: tetratricopeptide repeat protein [Elusimicrobiota bacterium]|nr:tetratricopeptide repeat protein [Elusimicrobiota bacterium]
MDSLNNPSSTPSQKDLITQKIERGALWAVRHWQQVLLASGVILLTSVLVLYVGYNLKKTRLRAWEQLSFAQSQLARGEKQAALDTANNLLTNYRSGAIVAHTNMFKGDVSLSMNKPDDSFASYQEAARQATSHELKKLALIGMATAREQGQKWEEAEKLYSDFIKENPEHFLCARAYESLGRVHMILSRWTDAQASFERLITLYPTTVWAKNAQEYLTQIKIQSQSKPAIPSKK